MYDDGLNIIPIKADGSKQPRIRWAEYQTAPFPRNKLAQWFGVPGDPSGIAVVCGKTSGNLEILDFDLFRLWPLWCDRIPHSLLSTLPIVQTPDDGRHVYYRCDAVEGNLLLARNKAGEVLIETRGQGGYAIAPGSPPSTHPTGKPYRMEQGDLRAVPCITTEQRTVMLDAARGFNVYVEPPKPIKPIKPIKEKNVGSQATAVDEPAKYDVDLVRELYGEWPLPDEVRPGDDFNERVEWSDVLEPHGWTALRVANGVTYWRKPGSSGNEHHATTNYDDKDQLAVYSTSVEGFEASSGGSSRPYSKFAAYTILNHDGDFVEAAKKLQREGFGSNND
jgi:putative DNA primase/helicase